MEGPSGFFVSVRDSVRSAENSFELLHTSEEGYSVLYLGNSGGKKYVYKALQPQFRGVRIYEDLLRKEFSIACQFDHPNICQYYRMCSFEQIGNAIEMEWVNGVSLAGYAVNGRKDGLRIGLQLCDALGYFHGRQVIHRDLKPSNVMITHNGGNVKVIDFGYSDSDSFTLLKAPAGTAGYASPEQIAGVELDGRSDIYSLGRLMREFLPGCRSVARRCLRPDRERRPKSASEVADMLKRRRWMPVLLVAALLLVAGGIWALVAGREEAEVDAPAEVAVEVAGPPVEASPILEHSDVPAVKKTVPAPAASSDDAESEMSIDDLLNEATKIMEDASAGD